MIYPLFNSGLEKPIRSSVMTASSRPPHKCPNKRASNSYAQRNKARQKLGTSKDVMPSKAGYTSRLCVYAKPLYEVSAKYKLLGNNALKLHKWRLECHYPI